MRPENDVYLNRTKQEQVIVKGRSIDIRISVKHPEINDYAYQLRRNIIYLGRIAGERSKS